MSLTITGKDESALFVSLVQYTQEHTNLVNRGVGAKVNLETDILARYVEQFVAEREAAGEPA